MTIKKVRLKKYRIENVKVLVTLILLYFFSFNLSADVGRAFKYKITIEAKEKNMTGFVYHYTYGEKYNPNKESFCDYFLREFNNSKFLYREIRSLKLNKGIEIDFYMPKNKLKFNFKDLNDIKLLEEKEFLVGDKVLELNNESVYNLINNTTIKMSSIYNQVMENCSIFIVNFNEKGKSKQVIKSLSSLVNKFYIENPVITNQEFTEEYESIRSQLLKEKVLVFNYCEAL